MSSLSPGAHSTCQEATLPPVVQLREIPTCQLLDTPSVENQPLDGAMVYLPVPAIGSQFALSMGIQPVPDKVFQSATTKDPSVNSSLQPATVPELPPAPATEPKLINKVDSLAAPATGALPTLSWSPDQLLKMWPRLPPSPGLLLISTKLTHSSLRILYATDYGAEPTPCSSILSVPAIGAQPTPVKSDSLSARHEEQRSPSMRAQPVSIILDPLPATRAAQLDLKVQPGPVFRSPDSATENHRVAATGPQTAVETSSASISLVATSYSPGILSSSQYLSYQLQPRGHHLALD
ncbi:uncharacterized protein ACWYII_014630 [Salvelinus alpinus]